MLTDEQWAQLRASTEKVFNHMADTNAIQDVDGIAVMIERRAVSRTHANGKDGLMILLYPTKNWNLEPPNPMEGWLLAAEEIGREHARNAASWVTDGNESDESRRIKLEAIQNGDPAATDMLPKQPNMSGEYADDYSEVQLMHDIGVDEVTPEQMHELVLAYLDGVDEEFEPACEKELMRWLGLLERS